MSRFGPFPAAGARWGRLRGRPSPVAGRRVLVTGASSGIGRASALAFAAAGAEVLLVARRADLLDTLVTEIEAAGGTARAFPADLTDPVAVQALVAAVPPGGVHYLVNNAGRSIRRSLSLSQDRFHDVERSMAINFTAPARLTLALLPAMRAQGFGHVVNVVSWGVQLKAPKFSAYLASKTALDTWSRVLAREERHHGIGVTNLRFGIVATEMVAPTEAYAGRGLSVEAAARQVLRACEERPVARGTVAGRVGEAVTLLAPRTVDWAFNLAHRRFGDSAAARAGASGSSTRD